jgi:hypothetical protein
MFCGNFEFTFNRFMHEGCEFEYLRQTLQPSCIKRLKVNSKLPQNINAWAWTHIKTSNPTLRSKV